MKILISGATGFVGQHLVNSLLLKKNEIGIIARKKNIKYNFNNDPKISTYCIDLLQKSDFAKIDKKFDIFIHLAAINDTNYKLIDSKASYEENLIITKNFVEFAKLSNAKQFILMSSLSAVGNIYNGERDETCEPTPDTPYGKSKLDSENIAIQFKDYFPITIFRPGLIIGPNCKGSVVFLMKKLKKKILFFPGNGNNYKSPICINNLITAIMLSINNSNSYNEIFCVTNNKNITMKELLLLFNRAQGNKTLIFFIPNIFIETSIFFISLFKKIKIRILMNLNDKLNKVLSSETYSCNKIINKLNYHPRCDFEKCIEETVEWYHQFDD